MKTLSIALILLATVACANADDFATNSKLEGYFPPSETSVAKITEEGDLTGPTNFSIPGEIKFREPADTYLFSTTGGEICFQIKNDIMRCIPTKWLYMMLVMMEAEDD
jgi:uncharacterized protein YdeI (BOF family)